MNDFDVWSFFRGHPMRPFPFRRNASADFGNPKFGKSPASKHHIGRRVDLHIRSLYVSPRDSPVDVLRVYLSAQKSASASALAEKAMILLYPREQIGTVVWYAERIRDQPARRSAVEARNAGGSISPGSG